MALISALVTAGAALASSATVAGLTTAASLAGSAVTIGSKIAAAGDAKKAAAASREAERIRMEQMRQEAAARRLQSIRQFQVSRANSVANVAAAGGGVSGTSALGAIGGAQSTLATSLSNIGTGLQFGEQAFAAADRESSFRGSAQFTSAIGSAVGAGLEKSPEIARGIRGLTSLNDPWNTSVTEG